MNENIALPKVKIMIGGEEFVLTFTLYAFAKLKKLFGINALKGELDFYDPEQALYFLWAGLISEQPQFDGDLIDGRPDKQLAEALKKLGTALTISELFKLGASIKQAFDNATSSGKSDAEQTSKKK